ncbi:hypothetical protein DBR06_SOUSAS2310202, partial [Sousa chinensis]
YSLGNKDMKEALRKPLNKAKLY